MAELKADYACLQIVAIYGHPWQIQKRPFMAFVKQDTHRQVVVRVCEALKAERIKQDISQQRLSELAGISRTGIRHLESLETSPTLASLLRVADALGVDLAKMLKSAGK